MRIEVKRINGGRVIYINGFEVAREYGGLLSIDLVGEWDFREGELVDLGEFGKIVYADVEFNGFKVKLVGFKYGESSEVISARVNVGNIADEDLAELVVDIIKRFMRSDLAKFLLGE